MEHSTAAQTNLQMWCAATTEQQDVRGPFTATQESVCQLKLYVDGTNASEYKWLLRKTNMTK